MAHRRRTANSYRNRIRSIPGLGDPEVSLSTAHVLIELAAGSTFDYHYQIQPATLAISPEGRSRLAADGSDGVRRLYLRATQSRPRPGRSPAPRTPTAPSSPRTVVGSLTSTIPRSCSRRCCRRRHADPESAIHLVGQGAAPGVRTERSSSLAGMTAGSPVCLLTMACPRSSLRIDRDAGVRDHHLPSAVSYPMAEPFSSWLRTWTLKRTVTRRIEALDLDSGERTILVEGGISPRYTILAIWSLHTKGHSWPCHWIPTR